MKKKILIPILTGVTAISTITPIMSLTSCATNTSPDPTPTPSPTPTPEPTPIPVPILPFPENIIGAVPSVYVTGETTHWGFAACDITFKKDVSSVVCDFAETTISNNVIKIKSKTRNLYADFVINYADNTTETILIKELVYITENTSPAFYVGAFDIYKK